MVHTYTIVRLDSRHAPQGHWVSGTRAVRAGSPKVAYACAAAIVVALFMIAVAARHRVGPHRSPPARSERPDEALLVTSDGSRTEHFPPAGAPTAKAPASVDEPADLYVSNVGSDTHSGAAGAPFRTLQHAADVVKTGQTVRVRAGKYAGMNFYGQSGGAPGKPIRFVADPGVTINTAAKVGPNADSGINLEPGKGWFIFSGFRIVNEDGSMERACIRVAGNSNTHVLRNTCEKPGTWGIIIGVSDDVLIQGNLCTDAAREHGLYVGRSSKRVTVRGNILRGNKADGFHLNGGSAGPIEEAVVEGNVIVGNGLSGIDADGVVNSVFRNNLVYGNTKHAVSLYNKDTGSGCTGNLFLNNTFVSTRMFAILMRPGSTANRLYNNILLQGAERRDYGSIGTGGPSTGLIADYNLIADRFSTDLGASRLTHAQWSDLTGQDRHSIVARAEQVFVDPSRDDYRLKAASPAIGGSTSDSSLHKLAGNDLLGNPRPRNGSRGDDLGAYQSGSTAR